MTSKNNKRKKSPIKYRILRYFFVTTIFFTGVVYIYVVSLIWLNFTTPRFNVLAENIVAQISLLINIYLVAFIWFILYGFYMGVIRPLYRSLDILDEMISNGVVGGGKEEKMNELVVVEDLLSEVLQGIKTGKGVFGEVGKDKESTYAEKLAKLSKRYEQLAESKEKLKSTLSELELEKAKSDALINSVGNAVVASSKGGNIFLMNNQAEKLLGWDKEKMLGKIIEKSLGPCENEGGDIPCEQMATCKAREGEVQSVVFDYNREGEIIKIEDVAAPISLNGEIIGVVDIMRDVTREKEVERAQREFVSVASHQLRTPTSTIAWHTELLLSDDLTKQQKELVEEIYQQNSRMRDLINALLNVSRIDLGKLRFLPQKMNIGHALELVLNDQKLLIGKKHIQVNQSVELKDQIVNDPIIIQVVLDNLVSNAVKYTPSEGQISIKIKPVSEETFQIQVKDTGMGIPNEEKSQIFSRLFRASNAKDKEPDGHGLGLYAVKTMIVAMGGKIWFETKLGQGTTFFVELPRNLKIQDKA